MIDQLYCLLWFLPFKLMVYYLQQIECVHNNAVMELMRGVRSQLTELISGLASQDLAPMSLGLSHSLSRYKLKFSPDKVNCFIVFLQWCYFLDAINLNTYCINKQR